MPPRALKPALALLLAATQLLAACQKPDPEEVAARSIADGSARAALQAHFDRKPQCASVLSGTVPLGLNSRSVADASPGERALFEAGLLRDGPAPDLTTLTGEPLEIERLRFYERFAEPTPEAAGWFRVEREGAYPETVLCYGRREVTRVWTTNEGLYGPNLHYAFRIVDVAPWTLDPRIRRVFPFLNTVLGGELEGGEQLITLNEDGTWRLEHMYPHIVVPDGELEAFLHCPRRSEPVLPGCEK